MIHLQPTIFLLHVKDYMLPCLNKQLFGLECPGCGMQRSILLLFDGEFLAAFKMYPAIFTLMPLALVLGGSKIFNWESSNRLVIGLTIASVALILMNYIIKLIN